MEDSSSEPREGATIMGQYLHHHNPSPKTPKNHLNLTHPTQAQAQAQLLHPRPNKEVVAYKECLKNHAASLGAHATDGCGEFIGGLLCSACGCHRNFHRKEVNDGGALSGSPYLPQCHYTTTRTPGGVLRARPGCGPHDTCRDDGREVMKKKRHRTKFTKEQKEKMMGFAEKAEWKIHKLEEGFILKFCQEIGIKRRVLKVWMHNNKHLFVKTLTNTTHHNLSPPPNHTISNSNSSHN